MSERNRLRDAGIAQQRFTMIRVAELLDRVHAYVLNLEASVSGLIDADDLPPRARMVATAVLGELTAVRRSMDAYQADMPAKVGDTFVQFPVEPQDLTADPEATPHGLAAWLLQRTRYIQRLFREAATTTTTDDVSEALDGLALHIESFAQAVARIQQSVSEV